MDDAAADDDCSNDDDADDGVTILMMMMMMTLMMGVWPVENELLFIEDCDTRKVVFVVVPQTARHFEWHPLAMVEPDFTSHFHLNRQTERKQAVVVVMVVCRLWKKKHTKVEDK